MLANAQSLLGPQLLVFASIHLKCVIKVNVNLENCYGIRAGSGSEALRTPAGFGAYAGHGRRRARGYAGVLCGGYAGYAEASD